MVAIGVASHDTAVNAAQAEAPEFEKVHWLSDPGLRKLYFWCSVLCVASATTGYDGYVASFPISKCLETNISGQNDVEHLAKYYIMARLFRPPHRKQIGFHELRLPDWFLDLIPSRVRWP